MFETGKDARKFGDQSQTFAHFFASLDDGVRRGDAGALRVPAFALDFSLSFSDV
jgi:hypothetical protein